MKNVLIVGMSPLIGGVEVYIYNLVKHMDKKDLSIDFLVVGSSSVFEDEINAFFQDGKNHFVFVPKMKRHYFQSNKILKRLFDSRKYDLIYVNTPTAARTRYCKYGINKKNIPLIVHSHSSMRSLLKNNFIYRKYVNKHCRFKLACSDLAGENVFGKKQKDIILIPNGVDISRFHYSLQWRKEIRENFKIPDDKIVIGHVGRFSEEKNHLFFIELAKRLSDDYIFMCIGDGDTKQLMVNSIEKNNLTHKFIILSSRNDIEHFYSAMDIFAMPSFYEGLPIVAVEAQAAGLPCMMSTTISKQVALSERCVFESIDGVDGWVKTIQNMDLTRYDGTKVIIENKFDVGETTKILKKLFDTILY